MLRTHGVETMTATEQKRAEERLLGLKEQLNGMTLEPSSDNIRLLSDVIEGLANVLGDTIRQSRKERELAVPGVDEWEQKNGRSTAWQCNHAPQCKDEDTHKQFVRHGFPDGTRIQYAPGRALTVEPDPRD